MDRSAPEYEGLLSEHKSDSLEDVQSPKTEHASPRTSRLTSSSKRSVTWLSCVISLFAVVVISDVATLAYMWRMFHTVYRTTDKQDLEFADPYIGLADLYASGQVNSSKIDPILIQPRVSAPVYRDRPKQLTPLGERDTWDEIWGTTSPNERHLLVNPNTNTVVQFRAIDFGMEDCELVMKLPGLAEPLETPLPFHLAPLSRFDVFRLDAQRMLDVRTLSYRTRPRAVEKLATVTPQPGAETSVARFACPRASVHTFEVACAEGEDCLVDVWSSQNRTWGMDIYQHQTI